MRLKLLLFLTLICTLYVTNSYSDPLFGTTGKIIGKVIDAKTNTPLPGAIVKLEGTTMGASTDDAGDYVIINIPVGTYRVASSYVGYKTEVQTEVKISADITTTVDFQLSEIVTLTDTVEIVARRNTISPDQSGKIITTESIENQGIRGIENIAAKTAGVVQDERGGDINIRGGRANETAVIIDGVLTTNPLSGESTAYVSNNLLQELSVLTGGFSAEYGNVLSGVINVTTKSGSTKYTGSAEIISDAFFKDLLNTSSQGYNLYNVNLGGPLIPTKKFANFINFYGGVERNFFTVGGPSWITPELNLPDDILPDYQTKRWSGNGKLNVDFQQLNKKLNLKLVAGTNISRTDSRLFVQSYMLYNAFRNPLSKQDNDQVYGKITHQLGQKVVYDLQVNWFRTQTSQMDPELQENLLWYGDPEHVPGITKGSRIALDKYGLFALRGRINNYYDKTETQYIEGSFNLTAQLKSNELKFGGNLKYHTIRYYQLAPIGLITFIDPATGLPPRSTYDGGIALANYWGYTYDGSDKDNSKPDENDPYSFDGAKHPIIGALYLQDKIEFKDFTINAGLRFDYLDANTWRIRDISNVVQFGDPTKLDIADFDTKSQPTYAFSPRLGFSFPVTDRTIFHAQYGKFIQLPQLEFLYNGFQNLSYWVNSAGFSGSFGNPNLKPEKTTSYEIGIKQTLGDRLSLDVTTFYKETEDLIGIKKYPQLPNQIQVYDNQDYGTIRGVDVAVELRRISGLAMSIAYSLSYASGTGSNPNSAGTAAWLGTEQPKFTFPLDFDQRHTGSINLDYRFGKEQGLPKGVWGSILSRLGLNLLYSFNSGRPYSKKDPSANPFVSTGGGAQLQSTINGAVGPWNHRLDLKIDKTVTIWKLDFNFYSYIINVLNTQLINEVWAGSGDPGNTGYLSTNQGINLANSYDTDSDPTTSAEEFRYLYGLRSKTISNYGPPRQIRFGIKVNF
jgi:outer membrane receptor protein involved in Fe transport